MFLNLNTSLSMYLFCNSRIHVTALYSGHVCVYYASMLRCWHLVWILVRTDHPCLGVGCHKKEVRRLIVGRVPIFWEVWGKLISEDLNVDDEGSEQRRFEPVQSLHHSSIGYQSVRTRIGLTKKTMSMQANREHKQELERTISNCKWMISSRKLVSYKPNVGETVLDRLI
jgi:hypothetical protein